MGTEEEGSMGFHEEQEKAQRIQRLAKQSAVLIGKRMGNMVDGIEAGIEGMETESRAMRDESQRLGDSMFRTLFMGTFKNGKSTTINAILGDEMLPAKATAATAVISQVSYGTDKNHVRVFRTGRNDPEVLTLQAFFQQYQLTEEDEKIIESTGELDRFADIEYVEMQSDLPLFKDGVQFIDSPGLEEASARTKTTDNFVPKANAIIFLLDATKLFSEKEKTYVKVHFEYADTVPRNVFFLVNRFNQLNTTQDQELVRKSAAAHLKPVFTDDNGNFDTVLMGKRVFFINAYKALQERKAGRVPYDTGMLEFQAALEEFLTSEDRIIARYQPVIAAMAASCLEVRHKNQLQEQAMQIPYEELNRNYAAAERELSALESDLDKMRAVIMKTCDNVRMKIVNSLRQFVSTDMPAAWPAALAKCDKKFGMVEMVKVAVTRNDKKRAEILHPLVEFVNDFIEDEMSQWGKTVNILIKEDLEDMESELDSRTQEFSIKMDSILSQFTGVRASAGSGGGANKLQLALSLIQGDLSVAVDNAAGGNFSWGDFIKKYIVQAIINLTILSMFTGGAAVIVALIVEAVQIQANASKRRDQILDNIAANIFPELRRKVEEQIPEVEGTVREQFSGQCDILCATAFSMLDDKKNEMQGIINQRNLSESACRQEKQRRESIYRKLFQNVAQVYNLVYDKPLPENRLDKLAAMTKKAEASS